MDPRIIWSITDENGQPTDKAEISKDGVVYTIPYNDFDDEMIDSFVKEVFHNIDWQTSQSYISEIDWTENINQYYKEKFDKEKGVEL